MKVKKMKQFLWTEPAKKEAKPKQQPNYEFVSSAHSKHLNCKLCDSLMLQPLRLHRCGHTFCEQCVGDKKIKQCPTCLSKVQAKQRDILCVRLVGELPVKCLNQGCPWRGPFEQYNNFHINGCKIKKGGIDAWLNDLKNTISQNSMQIGGLKPTLQSQDNQQNEEHHQQHAKQKVSQQKQVKQGQLQNCEMNKSKTKKQKTQKTQKKNKTFPIRNITYTQPQYDIQKRMGRLSQKPQQQQQY